MSFFEGQQVKGGWRCSLCSITYPNDRTRFLHCLACGDRNDYLSNATVDEDWADMAADLIFRWEGGDHNTFPAEWEAQTPPPETKPDPPEST